MDEILNELKGCDLEKEITLTHWCTMHQSETPVGKISKKDLIKKILDTDDVLFVHGIFWDE